MSDFVRNYVSSLYYQNHVTQTLNPPLLPIARYLSTR